MRRTVRFPLWWVAALGGCTPLGLWVYDDPAFEVSRVRLEAAQVADSTVTVALYVWNPNDYDLSATRFELRLRLDGQTVGHYERDSVIPVPSSGTAMLSLPFLPASAVKGRRIEAFRSGTHRFLVEGRAVFTTPFGERRVRVAHGGDMAFGGTVEPVSGGEGSQTRPGLPMPNRWPGIWRLPEPRMTR